MNSTTLHQWVATPGSVESAVGYFDYYDLYQEMVRQARDGDIFAEVGSLVGKSTCFLGQAILESRKAIRVVAVDTCRGSASDEAGVALAASLGGSYAGILARNIHALGLSDIVTVMVADSVQAASLFPAGHFRFVFLDADHSEDGVRRDIAAWSPKVAYSGTLAGHDWRHDDFPGVSKAVREVYGDCQDEHSVSCWSVVIL